MEKLINLLSEICPNIDFAHETALVDDGLIDSFEMVSIVSTIMENYDIELDVDDLMPENFNSVNDMIKLIQARKS